MDVVCDDGDGHGGGGCGKREYGLISCGRECAQEKVQVKSEGVVLQLLHARLLTCACRQGSKHHLDFKNKKFKRSWVFYFLMVVGVEADMVVVVVVVKIKINCNILSHSLDEARTC